MKLKEKRTRPQESARRLLEVPHPQIFTINLAWGISGRLVRRRGRRCHSTPHRTSCPGGNTKTSASEPESAMTTVPPRPRPVMWSLSLLAIGRAREISRVPIRSLSRETQGMAKKFIALCDECHPGRRFRPHWRIFSTASPAWRRRRSRLFLMVLSSTGVKIRPQLMFAG